MRKTIAILAAAAALLAVQAPAIAGETTVARPLHARLIAAPTYAAFSDAARLVTVKPVQTASNVAPVAVARPLHARLIATPTFAAFADAAKLRVRKDAEVAMLTR